MKKIFFFLILIVSISFSDDGRKIVAKMLSGEVDTLVYENGRMLVIERFYDDGEVINITIRKINFPKKNNLPVFNGVSGKTAKDLIPVFVKK